MFRFLLSAVVALLLACTGARAQTGSQEFDPRQMTRTEVQVLQDALIWASSYGSLKDGGWGRMTSEATRDWRRENGLRQSDTFTEAELGLLFNQAARERQAAGWRAFREPNTGIWIGYPSRHVSPGERRSPEPGVVAVDFKGGDDAVSLTALRNVMDLASMRAFLGVMATAPGVARVNYRLDREQRQVLSGDLHEGSTIYVRFDRVGAEWKGFLLRLRHDKVNVGRLIVAVSAEFSATGSPVIENLVDAPVLGPALARLGGPAVISPVPSPAPEPVGRLAPAPASPPPAAYASAPASPTSRSAPEPVPAAPRAEKLAGSGTAFVVRKDGLFLTNQHVTEDCARMALADGTRLEVVAADKRRDLALLRANELSTPEVVRFRRDATVDLGEEINLFGFPLYGEVTTSMNLTNGIVTALVGLSDDPMRFQINAAMQPGNSGGPLLDDAGLLVGVAVSRLSDRSMVRATGMVAQSMNFAIRSTVADSFLLENGVLVEKAPGGGKADRRDVARQMQTAVRPVLCYR